MAYVKIMFQDSPSTATPLNAENLNHMDDQIALNDQRLTEIETSYVKSFNGRKGEVTPQANDYNMSQITPTNGATVGQIPIVRNDGTAEEPNLTFHMEDVPSSGHVIKNQSGTSLAQEDALQFSDSFLTDDSANGRTVVENAKEVSPADYASTTDEGIIVTDDGNDALIGAVSDDIEEVTGNGSKTYATLLNELYTKIDKSKLTPYSKIVMISQYGTMQYDVVFYTNSIIVASQSNASASDLNTDTAILSSASEYYQYRNGTSGDASSTVLNNGGRITLYYGNKKAVVDLQTTANRCLYDSNTTVKQKIDSVHSWTKLGEKSNGESVTVDLSNYSEILIATRVGSQPYSSFIIPVGVLISESSEHKFYGSLYQDTTYNAVFRIQYSSGSLYFYQESLNGWQSLRGIIYVK